MNLGENIRVALRALGANKLRSALTMLGIIIGVGAVVGLLAIGNGASAVITNQVQGIGSNLVQVVAGRIRQGGQSTQGTLYLSDYLALERELKNVAGIAPLAQASGTVTYERETLSAQVTASTPAFLQVRSYEERSMGCSADGGNARACAFLEVARPGGGGERFGVGIDANIVTASIRALVSGLNRLWQDAAEESASRAA